METNHFASDGANVSSTASRPYFGSKDNVEIIVAFGQTARVQLSTAHTNGVLAYGSVEVPAQNGPPYHVHSNEDEFFFIRKGTFEFTIDGTSHILNEGGILFGPRDVPHTFLNIGDEPGEMNVLAINGTFDQFFRECSVALAAGAEMPTIIDISTAHGIYYLGPDAPTVGQSKQGAKPKIIRTAHPVAGAESTSADANWLDSTDTGGAFVCAYHETDLSVDSISYLNAHEDTLFVIEKGNYEFTLDGTPTQASSGDSVWVPRDTSIAYRRTSDTPATMAVFKLTAV
jgi:quercetin dioxygenase-like cupin family protein